MASGTEAEAGHSAARRAALEGLGRDARCRPPHMELEGCSVWMCPGNYPRRCLVEAELPFSFGIGTQDVDGVCTADILGHPATNTGLCAQKWFSSQYQLF